jgi:hypothetical protein
VISISPSVFAEQMRVLHEAGIATLSLSARPCSDLLALERLDMHYFRDSRLFQRLVSGEARTYIRLRSLARAVRSWLVGRLHHQQRRAGNGA